MTDWPPTPERLRTILLQLKRRDHDLRAFGAKTHNYELNPTVSASVVKDWEARHKVYLPDVYREFLINFGNGGAGPDYGILSLDQVAREFDPECPICAMNDSFVPPASAEETREYPTAGVLPVAHVGCGNVHLLITAGPERGNMWAFLNDNTYEPQSREAPSYPSPSTVEQRLKINSAFTNELLHDNTRRLDFWGWYAAWVEQKLASLDSETSDEPGLFHKVWSFFEQRKKS